MHYESLFQSRIRNYELPLEIKKEAEKLSKSKYKINYFDPNNYDLNDWIDIGFSERQAETILKYKKILGGTFTSKRDIRNCFVISEDKYNEIQSFMLLPEVQDNSQDIKIRYAQAKNKKYQIRKFNPNDYSLEDWLRIGFSFKQAEAIIKYKNILGGKFKSKEQIKKCYVISDEKYLEISPFIQLPEREIIVFDNKKSKVNQKLNNINEVGFKEIIAVIKDPILSNRILSFKKGLGGFVSQEQFRDIYGITENQINLLIENFIVDKSSVIKIDLRTATAEQLQQHIYLRKYKNKIIEAQKIGTDPIHVISKTDSKYHFIVLYIQS